MLEVLEHRTAIYRDSEQSQISVLMQQIKSEIQRVLVKLSEPTLKEIGAIETNIRQEQRENPDSEASQEKRM